MTNRLDPLGDDTSGTATIEEVEHTADWALRVRGRDLSELLLTAARGLHSLLSSESAQATGNVEQTFQLESDDPEGLLVDWLNELVYWAEVEGVVFYDFDLTDVSPTHLATTARGRRVSHLDKHVKAVTYHNLEIKPTDAGLETTIVFDV